MAFTINQTGFERGATQLIFPDPPILMDRDEEEAADAVHSVAITGAPIVTQFVRSQEKTFLKIKLRYLNGAERETLRTLMKGVGPVTVKLTPGDATTILCMFGERDEQGSNPFEGDYATAQPDGSPVDPIFTQFSPELFLLRL